MAGERTSPGEDRVHHPARPGPEEDASRTGGTRRGSPDREGGEVRREPGGTHHFPDKRVDIDRER